MSGSGRTFLVLDIGTSDIKCACVDGGRNIRAQHSRKFPLEQREHFVEVDFDYFFMETMQLLKDCLHDKRVISATPEALLITSQAQTFAPVDAHFRPLQKGIVWLDERAADEAAMLGELLPDFPETAGFAKPLAAQYVSKLLWLKKHEPVIFREARAFPLINEFLAFQLTGKFYSDSTSEGMSGIFDYRQDSLNKKLLDILGLAENKFPEIRGAARGGEVVRPDIRKELGLSHDIQVYLCGNDQGASACGAGLRNPGDMSINFGTAMVFYTITPALTGGLTGGQIAGRHPVGDNYFLLNYESDFGLQMRRLKEHFFPNDPYDELFRTYLDDPSVDEKKPVSSVAELQKADAMPHRYCAGVIKYYVKRLKFHYSQIGKTVKINDIFVSGGMTRSAVWLDILRDTLKRPFIINNEAHAGIIGAVEIYLQQKN